MKNKNLYLIILLFPLIIMCKNSNKQGRSSVEKALAEAPQTHYLAVDGKDSAFLTLSDDTSKRIIGHLTIRYEEQAANDGTFGGSYRGDTLFVNYSFYLGRDSSRIFTNPLAFLKSKDSVILGTGKIITNMGRSSLDTKAGISFKNGRFRFAEDKSRQ